MYKLGNVVDKFCGCVRCSLQDLIPLSHRSNEAPECSVFADGVSGSTLVIRPGAATLLTIWESPGIDPAWLRYERGNPVNQGTSLVTTRDGLVGYIGKGWSVQKFCFQSIVSFFIQVVSLSFYY